MPEMPEVETICNGISKFICNKFLLYYTLNVEKLRYPINFTHQTILANSIITNLQRRSKYILFNFSSNQTLIVHLGMSGSFRVEHISALSKRPHDHVVFYFSEGLVLIYNDPRRFGFMELVATDDLEHNRHLMHLGPEPLSNCFHHHDLYAKLQTTSRTLKVLLLDQTFIAGLGNIYVSESLFRAGLAPERKGTSITEKEAERLATAIVSVLREAVDKGGSTLKDYSTAGGKMGYFQHSFAVYNRGGLSCKTPTCEGTIEKIKLQGRSTYVCRKCQS